MPYQPNYSIFSHPAGSNNSKLVRHSELVAAAKSRNALLMHGIARAIYTKSGLFMSQTKPILEQIYYPEYQDAIITYFSTEPPVGILRGDLLKSSNLPVCSAYAFTSSEQNEQEVCICLSVTNKGFRFIEFVGKSDETNAEVVLRNIYDNDGNTILVNASIKSSSISTASCDLNNYKDSYKLEIGKQFIIEFALKSKSNTTAYLGPCLLSRLNNRIGKYINRIG